MTEIPDDMSELVGANIPRVDLVGKAANGTSFFLRKGAADESSNMFSAETVRELIKEADLDPTTPLAEAEGDELAAAVPGSPEWETVDAASASKWISILSRAKNAVGILAERETVEAATADGDDIENAWNLEGAACAIDAAIGILASYAAGEEAEVALAEDAANIKKAAAGIDTSTLEAVETAGALVKAGRALSAANESALRNAADAIQKVLASLPPAPEAPVEKEASVAENVDRFAGIEAEMGITPADVTKAETPAPAETPAEAPAAEVAKAENLLAVYDAAGKLIGVIKPTALTAVDGGDAADEDDEDDAAETPAEDAAPAPVIEPGEDAAVVPGTETVQSPAPKAEEEDPNNVTKATTDIAALLKEALAPLAEQVAKAADLAGQVKVLKEQVAAYGREPDDRRSPLLNGATGVAGIAKRGDTATDEHADLRKAVAEATTPSEQLAADKALSLAVLKSRMDPNSAYQNTFDRFSLNN